MKAFENKVVIVIGSTAGIGKKAAEMFAQEGAAVIVTGRRKERGDQIVADIAVAGGKAKFYQLDCSILEECNQLIDAVAADFGRIDVLYYNAGVSTMGDPEEGFFHQSTEKLWDYVMQVNLKNAFFITQKVLPELKKTKGNIVFTSSGSGIEPNLSQQAVIYGISKAAMNYMVKLAASIVAPDQVRVNAIAPGLTMTDILAQAPKEVVDQTISAIPMRKACMPEDQANAVLFLASDSANSITGQVLCIDNGQTI